MKERPFAITRGFFVSGNTRRLQRIHTSRQPVAINTPIGAPQIISEQCRSRPHPRPSKSVQNPILRTGLINHNECLEKTDRDLTVVGNCLDHDRPGGTLTKWHANCISRIRKASLIRENHRADDHGSVGTCARHARPISASAPRARRVDSTRRERDAHL